MTEKRVLHIKHKLSADGATMVELNFARELAGRYVFDWLIFAEEGNDRAPLFEELGGNVYILRHRRRKLKLINKIIEMRELRAFFREHRYDIIHIDTDSLRRAEVLYCAKKEGVKKRIIHCHAGHGEKSQSSLERFKIVQGIRRSLIARLATDYIACSPKASEWMFTDKLRNSGKVVFLKNGIVGERYLFDEEIRKKTRKELGLNDDNRLIGHVGRFVPVKNHTFLIDSFTKASEEDPSLRLILIGSGELRNDMTAKISKAGVSDKVILIENTDRVQDYLFAMDIFALPSLFEGLPLTCLESQAAGLPTLISDNVAKEIKISPLAEFIPIDSADKWARKMIDTAVRDKAARISSNSCLHDNGYEIKDAAKILEGIYSKE